MSVVDQRRRELAVKIVALEQDLLAAKAELNGAALPMRLPERLLLRIFMYYRDEWLTKSDELQRTKELAGTNFVTRSLYNCKHNAWIRITHVCCHWRRISLADPSLWMQLSPTTLEGTEIFLQRSQLMPLSVSMYVTNRPQSVEIALLVLHHSSRIRHLRVRSFWYESRDPSPWTFRDFPQLRSLDLSHRRAPPFIRPTDQLPSLEQIRLSNYKISTALSIAAAHSPCLTRLHLHHSYFSKHYTWAQFIEALTETAPQLQELSLREGGLPERRRRSRIEPELPPLLPTISMPHLRILRMCQRAIPCTVVLNKLSIPSSATIKIECHCDWLSDFSSNKSSLPSEDDVLAVFGAVERALTVNVLGPPCLFNTLSFLLFHGSTTLHAEVRHSWSDNQGDVSAAPHYSLSSPSVSLSICNYDALRGVIDHSVKFSPWHTAEYLYVDPGFKTSSKYNQQYLLPEDSWRNVLCRLPSLREFSIPDRGEASLVSALAPRQHQAVCPALEVLQLRALAFKDDPPEPPRMATIGQGPFPRRYHLSQQEWLRVMHAVLQARRALQLGPADLRIRHNLQDPEPLRQLSSDGVRIQIAAEDCEDLEHGRLPLVLWDDLEDISPPWQDYPESGSESEDD
ncbi:hypothetical protein PsYK624_099940 [Phanerochaete sordida]|uniref:F-box domain-containing protein n=1 Tax=Phanerochaete sordida TaxID=48140 RepID=A0A9P3GFC9_9APHY|nr:hypothetical protein PsYK624_099940 [Phanerochaete sordida]